MRRATSIFACFILLCCGTAYGATEKSVGAQWAMYMIAARRAAKVDDWSARHRCLESALRVLDGSTEDSRTIITLRMLGDMYSGALVQPEKAEECYLRATRALEEIDESSPELVYIYDKLAHLEAEKPGHVKQALGYMSKAVRIAEEGYQEVSVADLYAYQAYLYMTQGRYDEANKVVEKVAERCRNSKNKAGQFRKAGVAFYQMIGYGLGDSTRYPIDKLEFSRAERECARIAADYFEKAFQESKTTSSKKKLKPDQIAGSFYCLAKCKLVMGRNKEAIQCALEGRKISGTINDPLLVWQTCHTIGFIQIHIGDLTGAKKTFLDLHRVVRESDDLRMAQFKSQDLLTLASIEATTGNFDEALKYCALAKEETKHDGRVRTGERLHWIGVMTNKILRDKEHAGKH